MTEQEIKILAGLVSQEQLSGVVAEIVKFYNAKIAEMDIRIKALEENGSAFTFATESDVNSLYPELDTTE